MSLNYFFSAFAILGSALILSSCASTDIADVGDVNQKKIHQSYSVDIDQNSGSKSAEAQFRFGGSTGTTLNLSGPASVTINDDEMNGDDEFFRGLVYNSRVSDDGEFTFVFTDADNTTYTNSITLNPIDLDQIPQAISGKSSHSIAWEGAPLGHQETVTIYAMSSNEMIGTQIGSVSGKGATSVDTDPRQIRTLLNGGGEIYIIRSVKKSLDEAADEGGDIRGDYRSESYAIDIKDGKSAAQQAQDDAELDQELKELEKEMEELGNEIDAL
jgi:hypothetical protein